MKTIGIMLTNLFGEYYAQLWPGFVRGVEERNVNLMVFPGRTENWPEGDLYQQSVIYSKISPVTVDALVVVAGSFSDHLEPRDFSLFFERFRDIPGTSIGLKVPGKIPILVDNRTGLEELIRHAVSAHGRKHPAMISGPLKNNEARIRRETFLEVCRSLGFDTSTLPVYDGDFMVQSGQDAVRRIFDSKKTGNHPDLLVCANDNMAFGAIRELKSLGYRVPADVAVTGFDNLKEARFSFPALSTVSQPIEEQGYQAVLTALDLSEGKAISEEIILPTRMILRASCGCYSSAGKEFAAKTTEQEDRNTLQKGKNALVARFLSENPGILPKEQKTRKADAVITNLLKSTFTGKDEKQSLEQLGEILHSHIGKGFSIRPWISLLSKMNIYLERNRAMADDTCRAVRYLGSCLQVVVAMLRVEQGQMQFKLSDRITHMRTYLGMMGGALTLEEINESSRKQLTSLGVESFYIVTYEEPVPHRKGDIWSEPDKARLIIGFSKGKDLSLQVKGKRITGGRLLPERLLDGKHRVSMIICSLHFREEVIGYMMVDLTDITREVYDILTGHISSTLKTASLFAQREASEQKLRDVLRDLEKSNTQLQRISEIDELTGLYNRRGFLNLARRSMELARQMGRGGLLFYADLDGLKQINDIHGHEEGDLAIKTASEILRNMFRNMDILSRLGGDEFTVLAVDTNEAFLPVLRRRMEELTSAANSRLGKPWKISISLGCAPFAPGDSIPLEKLMTLADKQLYREKRQKNR